jgi:hypothetical protein
MQRRSIRITILALLLILGIGAGSVVWSIDRQQRALAASRDGATERLVRILSAVGDIASAQQSYVAPGQSTAAAFEQTASQIQRIYAELQLVRPALQSVEAAELLGVLTAAIETLVEADGSARGHLGTGQTLWAAEVVYGQARDTRATMTQAVRGLQAAESRAVQTKQDALAQTAWAVLGIAGGVWALGLIALAWSPRQPRVVQAQPAADPLPLEPAPAAIEAALAASTVDLARAAAICTDISRLTSGTAVTDILARTAGALDATGIILWLGAGDDLYAAAAHGYDERVIARLGAIPRSADNATAAAWRNGTVGYVRGDVVSNGAIVAPMFGPEGCIGVLAAEVRHGREADADTRAVTAVIAAQLAMVLAAWPGPSTASAPVEAAPEPAAEAPEAPPLREASGL